MRTTCGRRKRFETALEAVSTSDTLAAAELEIHVGLVHALLLVEGPANPMIERSLSRAFLLAGWEGDDDSRLMALGLSAGGGARSGGMRRRARDRPRAARRGPRAGNQAVVRRGASRRRPRTQHARRPGGGRHPPRHGHRAVRAARCRCGRGEWSLRRGCRLACVSRVELLGARTTASERATAVRGTGAGRPNRAPSERCLCPCRGGANSR